MFLRSVQKKQTHQRWPKSGRCILSSRGYEHNLSETRGPLIGAALSGVISALSKEPRTGLLLLTEPPFLRMQIPNYRAASNGPISHRPPPTATLIYAKRAQLRSFIWPGALNPRQLRGSWKPFIPLQPHSRRRAAAGIHVGREPAAPPEPRGPGPDRSTAL